MPQQPCSPHGWTLDTLEKNLSDQIRALKDTVAAQNKQNIERFASAKEQVSLAMTAAEKAITKAEIASDKRFEGVNEFRATLSDQATLLMPRSEYTVQHQGLVDKVNDISTRLLKVETAALTKTETGQRGFAATVAIVSVCYSVVASIGVIVALMIRLR